MLKTQGAWVVLKAQALRDSGSVEIYSHADAIELEEYLTTEAPDILFKIDVDRHGCYCFFIV